MAENDFIKTRMDKARKAIEAEWEEWYKAKPSTPEGAAFSLRMKEKISQYAQRTKVDMNSRSRLKAITGRQGIFNAVNAFVLHLIRRNCDVGFQVKTLSAKDVSKAEAILDFVLDLCESEMWRDEQSPDDELPYAIDAASNEIADLQERVSRIEQLLKQMK